jgi:hypothetical protein
LNPRPDRFDHLLKAWANQARLQPAEAQAAFEAVLRRAAINGDIDAVSITTELATIAPWKVALEVANEVVRRARVPLWGSSWIPPLSECNVG